MSMESRLVSRRVANVAMPFVANLTNFIFSWQRLWMNWTNRMNVMEDLPLWLDRNTWEGNDNICDLQQNSIAHARGLGYL
jgi:hypothetical protein